MYPDYKWVFIDDISSLAAKKNYPFRSESNYIKLIKVVIFN